MNFEASVSMYSSSHSSASSSLRSLSSSSSILPTVIFLFFYSSLCKICAVSSEYFESIHWILNWLTFTICPFQTKFTPIWTVPVVNCISITRNRWHFMNFQCALNVPIPSIKECRMEILDTLRNYVKENTIEHWFVALICIFCFKSSTKKIKQFLGILDVNSLTTDSSGSIRFHNTSKAIWFWLPKTSFTKDLYCFDWASSQTAECTDALELRCTPIIIFNITSYW